VRQAVDFEGGDAGAHMRRQHVQHFGGKASCHTHAFDLGCGLGCDRHVGTHPGRRPADGLRQWRRAGELEVLEARDYPT